MAEPTSKRTKLTPRNSLAASPTTQTPFHVVRFPSQPRRRLTAAQLNALGKLHSTVEKPTTPAPSSGNTTGPRGANGSARTTPGTARASARKVPRRGGPPTTPHAIRAHMQSTQQMLRRATPARDRRRSGRLMRDTPRDDLQKLSRSTQSAAYDRWALTLSSFGADLAPHPVLTERNVDDQARVASGEHRWRRRQPGTRPAPPVDGPTGSRRR
jgi:hypothetical protein